MFVGTVRHLGKEERDQLTIEAMSTEAVTTCEIEGEILDRASVQSSLRKQLGLATDERRVRPAELGIAAMMVDRYGSFEEPLTEEMLFRWHRMLMSGNRNLREVGLYSHHACHWKWSVSSLGSLKLGRAAKSHCSD
jgi:Fic family protein